MVFENVNYLAILAAGIISMIVGFLWYGLLFGKTWMKLSNFDPKKMEELKKKGKEGMTKRYIIMFIGTLVFACVLAILLGMMNITTFTGGMWIGFLVWLGFYATTGLGMMLWEGKPFNLYVINMLHYLVVLLIIGGMLAVWS